MDSGTYCGFYVTLQCDNNTTYEGEVLEIDEKRQLITLVHAHQVLEDLSVVKFPRLTITGNHIVKLKIVRERLKPMEYPVTASMVKDKEADALPAQRKSASPSDVSVASRPKLTWKQRDENCFGTLAHSAKKPDFDFEKNLALFDKHAVYEEVAKLVSTEGNPFVSSAVPKMKVQENILESEPVSLRHIKVPLEHAGKEYSTEDGFVIPAITLSLKKKLFAAAAKSGLSTQQMVENAGICACQMTLTLVGGSLRINLKNAHQRPEIVVLAGCHTQGLQAICAARHLANHTAQVYLYLPDRSPVLQSQIDLFVKSGGKLMKDYQDLPTQPVDIIIDATIGLDQPDSNPDWLPYAVSWANQNKAPVLAIDPCLSSNPGAEQLEIKWGIAMALPLIKSPRIGRLYLADIGIPRDVFREVNITYLTPFKDKFCIPLYD